MLPKISNYSTFPKEKKSIDLDLKIITIQSRIPKR